MKSVDLAFLDLGGEGDPIVFLHGMFGSSRNWASFGRRAASEGLGRVFALDARNHGVSPHADTHSLEDCVGDLREWIKRHIDGPARIVGHSMGGLTAMGLALSSPELAAGLAVIDIAPRAYPMRFPQELAALRTDIRGCRTRSEMDALLAGVVPDTRLRQFLMTNAVRGGDGFEWRLNVEVLAASTLAADAGLLEGRWDGPTLFAASSGSGYVRPDDRQTILRLFPRARIETIPCADHWPHISAPEALFGLLSGFLAGAR